jgi:hypothetical protein
MSINPFTFNDVNDARTIGVHEVGTIWASMLFDMSANLVAEVGFNEDIYQCTTCSVEDQGGNNIALQLVIDAMKIQPCNPSFIEARDAILMADEIDYEGAHHCSIWESFARRGLGTFASDSAVASASFCVPDECQSTDFPACTSAPTPAPFSDVDLGLLEVGEVFVEGSTRGRSNTYGNPASDVRVVFTLPSWVESGIVEISLCSTSTDYDTYIWLLDSGGNLVASNDDSSCDINRLHSYLNLSAGLGSSSLRSGEEYVLVVDGYDSASGNFALSLSLETGYRYPTPSTTAAPTFSEDNDDDSDDVCDALYTLADKLGLENLCENILELDFEYQCGVLTADPTHYPTYVPTRSPTDYPTAYPTAFPTVVSNNKVFISVKIKISNNPQFTTEEPLYVIMLGENGQSEPLNIGSVTAGNTHFVEFEDWQFNLEGLYAIRVCADENEPNFTKFIRSKFLLSIDDLNYSLKNKKGKAKVNPNKCVEAEIILA